MAHVALRRPDERTEALRDTMTELLGMDEPRGRLAAEMSGLGIRYDLGEGHPLLGRRVPDLDLVTSDDVSAPEPEWVSEFVAPCQEKVDHASQS